MFLRVKTSPLLYREGVCMGTGQEQGRIAYPTLPYPLTTRDLKQLFTPWPDEIEWALNATWSAEARLGLLTLLRVFER